MRHVFRFLTNPWFMAALGLIAMAAVVWLLGPFIAIGDNRLLARPLARITTILIIILIWMLILLTRRLLAKRSDRNLLDGMSQSEAASEAPGASDASEDERLLIKKQFEDAIA